MKKEAIYSLINIDSFRISGFWVLRVYQCPQKFQNDLTLMGSVKCD